MRFIISGRGVSVGPALRARIEQKVGKLARILPKILEARVVLSVEKYRRTAELTLLAKRRTFRSEETAQNLPSALDLAVDALERQVRRTKDRLRQRKPRRVSTRLSRARGGGATGEVPGVVPRRLQTKPMSVEEAVMQFDLGDDQFLVFTNASTREINVLYRKSDGTKGLIEPVT